MRHVRTYEFRYLQELHMVAHYDLPMDGILLDGWGLSVDTVATVADGRSDRVRIAPSAIRAMDVASDRPAGDQAVYGAPTVVGDSIVAQRVPAGAVRPQRDLIRYHLGKTGPAAPRDVVRATLLIRVNCLARGTSGIRAEVVGTMLELLNQQALPRIPERAAPDEGGDLVPLCHVASTLLGESVLNYRGADRPAAEVLDELGLRPVELEGQEGLTLINGTAFSSAFASVATSRAWRLAPIAEICTALAAEAAFVDRDCFAPLRHDSRAYPGQATATEAIAELLADEELLADAELAPHPRRTPGLGAADSEDHYAITYAPQVIGGLRDTLTWVSDEVEAEINSADDSPLFDPTTGEVHSGAGVSGGHLAQAMDELSAAVANLADLFGRQLDQLDHRAEDHLRDGYLVGGGPAGPRYGLADLRAACWAVTEDALRCGGFARPTEAADEDLADNSSVVARDALHVVTLAEEATAIHLLALCTAFDRSVDRDGVGGCLGERDGVERSASRLRRVRALIREHVPSTGEETAMRADIAAVLDLIRSGELLAAC